MMGRNDRENRNAVLRSINFLDHPRRSQQPQYSTMRIMPPPIETPWLPMDATSTFKLERDIGGQNPLDSWSTRATFKV